MTDTSSNSEDDRSEPKPSTRPRPALPLRRKIAFSFLSLLATCLIAEGITTFLYMQGILEPQSMWIQENTGNGPSIVFDPIRGYKLTSVPSRQAYVSSNGVIESVGSVRGNNFGFPDRDDFEIKRSSPKSRRFAVFGDSFTASQFLNQNWPDKAEDLARGDENPLELYNFSVDGSGLPNWWSILTRLIATEEFELDGLVFAVWRTDIRRGFLVLNEQVIGEEDDDTLRTAAGYIKNVDPDTWPSTLAEAEPLMRQAYDVRTYSTSDFDLVLAKKIRPRMQRDFRFYLWSGYSQRFSQWLGMQEAPRDDFFPSQQTELVDFDPQRKRLMDDIREFAKTRNIPILVVHIPSREGVLRGVSRSSEARSFAKYLDAEYADGSLAFENLSKREIRQLWLPYDQHWNQAGSDRFAQHMVEVLQDWQVPIR